MIALARDTHWQALVAATILEEKMERMSCSCSHQWRRSQSLGTLTNGEEPRTWCWVGWGPPTAPDMAEWGGAWRRGWLVMVSEGGGNCPHWRRRSRVSTASGTPPPGTPRWGRAIPSQLQGLRWTATPANSQGSEALSPVTCRVDQVAHPTCPNAKLVGGTGRDAWSWGLPAICQEGACLLWGAQGTTQG